MIIGLTGSSGSGKSTVAKMFADIGCAVIDCDEISRYIDAFDEYKSAVKKEFGKAVFDENGNISRRALGKTVFSDEKKLKALSHISHPIIKKEVLSRLDRLKGKNAVIDAPLLFEGGLDGLCDVTVGVIADDDMRANRVAERDGLPLAEATARVRSQEKAEFYRGNCTYIIENNGGISALESSFSNIIERIGIKKSER